MAKNPKPTRRAFKSKKVQLQISRYRDEKVRKAQVGTKVCDCRGKHATIAERTITTYADMGWEEPWAKKKIYDVDLTFEDGTSCSLFNCCDLIAPNGSCHAWDDRVDFNRD